MLYTQESEFQAEQSGKVRILKFSNVKVTAGSNAGQSVPKSESYIYRIDGKQFLEVHSLLEGDTRVPASLSGSTPPTMAPAETSVAFSRR